MKQISRRSRVRAPGVALIVLALIFGTAALQRPSGVLIGVFGFSIGLFVASGAVSGMMMIRLRVTRKLPTHARVGDPMRVEYRIRNRARIIPACDVTITELASPTDESSAAWCGCIHRRGSATASSWIIPRTRGTMQLEKLTLSSEFPLGLLHKSIVWIETQSMIVLPQVRPLRPSLIQSLLSTGHEGRSLGVSIGFGEDPIGLREWRPGDEARQVAWVRSSAPGELIVVDRAAPSQPRVRIVLDLRTSTADIRAPQVQARGLEERAIVLVASLVSAASEAGIEVGLEIVGIPTVLLAPRRGTRHVERVHRALALLDLDQQRIASRSRVRRQPAREIVVHPERSDTSLGNADAIHLTASQLASLEEVVR